MAGYTIYTSQKVRTGLKNLGDIYLVVLIAVYFICSMSCPEVYAATIAARSCSDSDVASAVSTASSGDTVIVPAGTCTWTSEVTTTKAIKIQGAGIDATIIRQKLPTPSGIYKGYWLLKYIPSSPSSDANVEFEVTGFTFDGVVNTIHAGAIMVRNESTTAINKVKIHDNKFLNCYGGEKSATDYTNTIMIEGTVYGVIYSNSFYGLPRFAIYGYTGDSGGLQTWNEVTWQPGSAKSVYFEDNLDFKEC